MRNQRFKELKLKKKKLKENVKTMFGIKALI